MVFALRFLILLAVIAILTPFASFACKRDDGPTAETHKARADTMEAKASKLWHALRDCRHDLKALQTPCQDATVRLKPGVAMECHPGAALSVEGDVATCRCRAER